MDTNENLKNNKKAIKLPILLSILLVVIILAGFAWARYTTILRGESSTNIAKWSFKVSDGITKTENIENLAITRTDDNNEVQKGYLAPRNKWNISD